VTANVYRGPKRKWLAAYWKTIKPGTYKGTGLWRILPLTDAAGGGNDGAIISRQHRILQPDGTRDTLIVGNVSGVDASGLPAECLFPKGHCAS
jgi:hypothetical protein